MIRASVAIAECMRESPSTQRRRARRDKRRGEEEREALPVAATAFSLVLPALPLRSLRLCVEDVSRGLI
jgi:hypothetical protein